MRREQGVRVAAIALTGVLLTCCGSGAGTGSGSGTASGTGTGTGAGGTATAVRPPTASAPAGMGTPIDTVTVTNGGLKISVQALGGGCRRLSLQAAESATEVRLTLTTTRPPGICPPYVRLVEVGTTLHAPVGHRILVDTTTGRPVIPQTH
jgi:hypothetical protein